MIPVNPTPDFANVTPYLGRIGQSVEGGGKRRLFAIGNWVNQRLLHPFHKWLMKVLRKLPMDGTFNQTAPLERLVGSRDIYSVDLKSATDRWPFLFQNAVVDAWSNVFQWSCYVAHGSPFLSRFHLFMKMELCAATREQIRTLYKIIFFGRQDPLLFIPESDLDYILRSYLEPIQLNHPALFEVLRSLCQDRYESTFYCRVLEDNADVVKDCWEQLSRSTVM